MSTDPAVSPTPEPRWLVECDLGIDCAEAGRCYAVSNGRPDMCPTAEHGGVVFGSWTTDKGSRFLTAAASSSSPTPDEQATGGLVSGPVASLPGETGCDFVIPRRNARAKPDRSNAERPDALYPAPETNVEPPREQRWYSVVIDCYDPAAAMALADEEIAAALVVVREQLTGLADDLEARAASKAAYAAQQDQSRHYAARMAGLAEGLARAADIVRAALDAPPSPPTYTTEDGQDA